MPYSFPSARNLQVSEAPLTKHLEIRTRTSHTGACLEHAACRKRLAEATLVCSVPSVQRDNASRGGRDCKKLSPRVLLRGKGAPRGWVPSCSWASGPPGSPLAGVPGVEPRRRAHVGPKGMLLTLLVLALNVSLHRGLHPGRRTTSSMEPTEDVTQGKQAGSGEGSQQGPLRGPALPRRPPQTLPKSETEQTALHQTGPRKRPCPNL